MADDDTELAAFQSPTEHAHAWSLDSSADTVPYLDTRQNTTLLLRVCVALTGVSVAALIAVLLFVFNGKPAAPPAPAPAATAPPPAVASTPVAQAAPEPAATPTVTETRTVAAAPPPAPAESTTATFLICGDGREGVIGGHTSCLFAQNVRRAFFGGTSSSIVAYSPVTGERYEMTCAGGYRAHFDDGSQRVATRCVGGDNDTAEVLIW